VHLAVVTIARSIDTISNAFAAPSGLARARPPPSLSPPLGL